MNLSILSKINFYSCFRLLNGDKLSILSKINISSGLRRHVFKRACFQFYPRSTLLFRCMLTGKSLQNFQFYPRSTSMFLRTVYGKHCYLSILSKINAVYVDESDSVAHVCFQFYPRSTWVILDLVQMFFITFQFYPRST